MPTPKNPKRIVVGQASWVGRKYWVLSCEHRIVQKDHSWVKMGSNVYCPECKPRNQEKTNKELLEARLKEVHEKKKCLRCGCFLDATNKKLYCRPCQKRGTK